MRKKTKCVNQHRRRVISTDVRAARDTGGLEGHRAEVGAAFIGGAEEGLSEQETFERSQTQENAGEGDSCLGQPV